MLVALSVSRLIGGRPDGTESAQRTSGVTAHTNHDSTPEIDATGLRAETGVSLFSNHDMNSSLVGVSGLLTQSRPTLARVERLVTYQTTSETTRGCAPLTPGPKRNHLSWGFGFQNR